MQLERGRLLIVMVSLLGAGCSDGPPSGVREGAPGPAPAVTVAESPAASATVAGLRARFSSAATRDRLDVFGRQVASGFERVQAGIRPTLPSRASLAQTASVTLPDRAAGAVLVENDATHLSVSFVLRGAADVEAAVTGGLAVYERGGPSGAHVVHRPTSEGTEDYVVFETRPAVEELHYALDVSRVAGLRLVSNTLELLDANGTPRLRVAPPYVVDVTGATREAKLGLEGCAVDVDPRAPWGRPVTPPSASACKLRVTWSGVAYPAAVDPSWTTAGSMSRQRSNAAGDQLADGRLLVSGGYSVGVAEMQSAEIFDPKTKTWSGTGSMVTARNCHTATRLPNGRVLVSGGLNSANCTNVLVPQYPPTSSAELYDPTNGTWLPAAAMSAPRFGHTATRLGDGSVLVAGGPAACTTTRLSCTMSFCDYCSNPTIALTSVERYDPGTSAWSSVGPMSTARMLHTATRLGDGRVLVAGGSAPNQPASCVGGFCTLPTNDDPIASTELFDPVSKTWSPGPALPAPRSHHAAAALSNGGVLIVGGCASRNCAFLTSGEVLWDGIAASWSPAGSLTTARRDHSATGLSTGGVLVAGGANAALNTFVGAAELFDPQAGTWGPAGNLVQARADHVTTLIPGDAVLVTGGINVASTEIWVGTPLADGGACGIDIACSSGYCVDGVCCNTPCTQTCYACSAAKKGGGANGVCDFIAAGQDPDAECGILGSGACQSDSVCSGAGACRALSQGTVCQPSSCATATTQVNASTCSDTALCTSNGTSACSPYLCLGSACATSCSSSADCASGFVCFANQCGSGAPNGASCTADTECQSRHCADSVCCDRACSGPCEACTIAKRGAGQNGECGPIQAGSDPDSECAADLASSCQKDGYCDGAGACRLYASGTVCGSAQCVGNAPQGQLCDGLGACKFGSTGQDCGYFRCVGGVCPTSCAVDGDCVSGAYCSLGRCQVPGALGASCTMASQCQSNQCVDGVCCNAPCAGQCEACNLAGKFGTCSPVSGAPIPPRTACAGSGPCEGSCNGAVTNTCTYPSLGTPCTAGACSGDVLLPGGSCDGAGVCTTPSSQNCAPYGCNAVSGICRTACVSSADCAAGAGCDTASGECAPISGTCKDAFTVVAPNGQESSCAPYKCVAGACQQQCVSDTDCAPGYACESSACRPSDAGATGGTGGNAGSADASSGGSAGSNAGTGGSSGGAGTAGSSGQDSGVSGSAGSATSGAGGSPTRVSTSQEGGCGCTAPNSRSVPPVAVLAVIVLGFAARRRRRGSGHCAA